MAGRIKFEEVMITDPITKKRRDAVAVMRDGRQVAVLPEVNRLRRALNLRLEELEHIVDNFIGIMGREPTPDEREFWRAVLDYKRSQS